METDIPERLHSESYGLHESPEKPSDGSGKKQDAPRVKTPVRSATFGTAKATRTPDRPSSTFPTQKFKPPVISPGKNRFATMSDREKADAYFEEKKQHMELKTNFKDLEQQLKKMSTKLMKVTNAVQHDRKQAEVLAGRKLGTDNIAKGVSYEDLVTENGKLKGELKQARVSISKAQSMRNQGKAGHTSKFVGNKNPRQKTCGIPSHFHEHELDMEKNTEVNKEQRELIERLRNQLALTEKELLKARQNPGIDHSSRIIEQSHKVQEMEDKYEAIEENFEAQRTFLEFTKRSLDDTQEQLRQERIKNTELETKLRFTENSSVGQTDIAKKLLELQEENKKLEQRVKELCASPFIKEAGDRTIERVKIATMEKEIEQNHTILIEYKEKILRLESSLEKKDKKKRHYQAENKKLTKKNLKLSVDQGKHEGFIDQLTAMGEDVDSFMKALGIMKLDGEEPAWNTLDFVERQKSVEEDLTSLRKENERLKREKAQIAAELEKAHTLLSMKGEIDKERNNMHQRESESQKYQLQSAQRRAEDLAKLADFRGNRVVELEKNRHLNAIDEPRVVTTKANFRMNELDVIQEFASDMTSEIGTGENILDLWLGEAEFYEMTLTEMLGERYYSKSSFASFMTLDFYNFETQTSSYEEGIKPKYNVHVSFKVSVDDHFIVHLEHESIKCEAHAARGQDYQTLGSGLIPLAEILRKENTRDPSAHKSCIIEAAAPLKTPDGKTDLGVMQYKMRLRFPINEALHWYKEKQDVIGLTHPSLQEIDFRYKRDALAESRRLSISILRCLELKPYGHKNDEIEPFAFFQFAGYPDHTTPTSSGMFPVFEDTHIFEVKQTHDLKRYLDTQTLEIAVFDDKAAVHENGDDVIGTTHVPLKSLLLDTPVDGHFPLANKYGEQTGHIHIRIGWVDVEAPRSVPLGQQWQRDAVEMIARNLNERKLNLQSAFKVFDQDNDGLISPQEFRSTLLVTLRIRMSEQEVQQILNACNTPDGNLTETEFQALFGSFLPNASGGPTAGWEEQILELVRERIQQKGLNLREAFEAFDENNDGVIDEREFKRTMRVVELGLTDIEIDRILKWFDPNGTGRIMYKAFCAKLVGQQASTSQNDQHDPRKLMIKLGQMVKKTGLSLREAFEVFDTNLDGKIERGEFFRVFQDLRVNITNIEIQELWESLEKDKNGYLHYQEFCNSLENQPSIDVSEAPRVTINILRQKVAMEIINKGTKIRQIFKTFDKNHNGTLSRSEFREVMEMFKLGLTTEEVELLVQEADSNRDGNIDYEEFCEFVNPVGNTLKAFSRLIKCSGKTLKDVFNLFDKDRSGAISHAEFREACAKFNLGMTPREIEELINFIDKSRDGRIDFNEFQRYMESTRTDEHRIPPKSPEIHVSPQKDPRTRALEEIVQAVKNSGINLKEAFDVFDRNRDGFISHEEFKKVFNDMKLGLNPYEIESVIQYIDTSRDGRISITEFITIFRDFGYEDGVTVVSRKKLRSVTELFEILDQYMRQKNIPLSKLFTEIFDVNKDSFIERKELENAFNKLTHNPLTNSELDLLMQEICHGQVRFRFDQFRSVYNTVMRGSRRSSEIEARQSMIHGASNYEASMSESQMMRSARK